MSEINIWSLDKEQQIKFLLLSLDQGLGSNGFVIDAESVLDRRAVYLHHATISQVSAYLHIVAQAPDRYGLDLEFPDTISSGDISERYENLSLESVIQILAVHFDVASVLQLSL